MTFLRKNMKNDMKIIVNHVTLPKPTSKTMKGSDEAVLPRALNASEHAEIFHIISVPPKRNYL